MSLPPPAEARRFPSACVSTPHYLATATGVSVLAGGGNAVDAAVAATVTLAVVAPYTCGFGGDCLALVWDGGGLHGYDGSGRAPEAATLEAVRAAVEAGRAALEATGPAKATMPVRGPLTVTVPGAVDAWFALLGRFGTRTFAEVARPARRLAAEGFPLTARGAAAIGGGAAAALPGSGWEAVYGSAGAGRRLRQAGLARTIEALSAGGAGAFYRGPVGAAVAAHVEEQGGLLSAADLRAHQGDWVTPLSTGYRSLEVVELPPPSQGSTALFALNLLGAVGPLPVDPAERQHLLVEAVKLALAERDAHLTDPAHMRVAPGALADPARAAARRQELGSRAAVPAPAVRPAGGGTAAVCAADSGGLCVSLIASNYTGFGSGLTVPGFGVNLHNRGAYFSLDPAHVNVIAPGKRTLHTLMPAMALSGGTPWCALGAMGGDGQAQTHVQILVRLVDDGDDIAAAVAAPRWLVDPSGRALHAEARFPAGVIDGLRLRGHDVRPAEAWDSRMGHAQAILLAPGSLAGAADPRSEGEAAGL